MTADFLGQFVGNPGLARVLRVFAANNANEMPVSSIAKRAGVSTKVAIREIQALARLNIVKKTKGPKQERQKRRQEDYWVLNDQFRYERALSAFVLETSPARFENVEKALRSSGRLPIIVLSGVFVGDPTRPADILIAGDSLNESRLEDAVRGLEPLFGREIRYAAFSTPEFRYRLTIQDRLVRDTLDFPHRILVNKGGVL